jgi:hypothetical protein
VDLWNSLLGLRPLDRLYHFEVTIPEGISIVVFVGMVGTVGNRIQRRHGFALYAVFCVGTLAVFGLAWYVGLRYFPAIIH